MGTLQLGSLREPETVGDLRELMQQLNGPYYHDRLKVRERCANLAAWEIANIRGQLLDTFRANRVNRIADDTSLPDDIKSMARRMIEIMMRSKPESANVSKSGPVELATESIQQTVGLLQPA